MSVGFVLYIVFWSTFELVIEYMFEVSGIRVLFLYFWFVGSDSKAFLSYFDIVRFKLGSSCFSQSLLVFLIY